MDPTAVRKDQVHSTQSERRARTQRALVEAGARGISRVGYGNLVLAEVAAEAGYTRGALYHLFKGKEELALAVVGWVAIAWDEEVWQPAQSERDPLSVLVAVARRHAAFCRQEIARVMMSLRVEFDGRRHPVGDAVRATTDELVGRFAGLIKDGTLDGLFPSGPPADVIARAGLGAIEGLAIEIAGVAPHDEDLAEAVIRGLSIDWTSEPLSTP